MDQGRVGLRYRSKKANVSRIVWLHLVAAPAVAGADEQLDAAGDARGGLAVGQLGRLRVRDERVLGPLEGQDRRIVLGDVRQRRRLGRRLGLLLRRPAEEVLDDRRGDLGDVGRGEVGRPEVVDDRLDLGARRVAGGVPFQAVLGPGHAEHHRQVPAGREPDRADVVGVDLVLLGVPLEPADGRLDVVDLRRERVLGGEPILRRDRHVAAAGELEQQRRACPPSCPRASRRRGSRAPPGTAPPPRPAAPGRASARRRRPWCRRCHPRSSPAAARRPGTSPSRRPAPGP